MDVRRTVPDNKNKYYLKQPSGWNTCILGNPENRLYPMSVLANCVGWAVARFNECCRQNNCKWLGNRNPGGFLALARTQGLETGTVVRPGCIIVMLKADNNNGHVIFIEKTSGGSYYTSESGWDYAKGHYMTNRWIKKSTNYGMDSRYHFAGCIYNPNIDPYDIPPADFNTYKTKTGKYVKFVQWILKTEGCYSGAADIDGIVGPKTVEAIKRYQKKHGLTADGYAGPKTLAVMKADHAII